MIKYIWLMILILYGFCQAQPEDKVGAILRCSTTPQPSASGFSTGLCFPVFAQLSSTQTRSAESRNIFIQKSRLCAQQIHQKEVIEQTCRHASLTEVADFFERGRLLGLFSDKELLTWYMLYQSSSYRAYVKGLPGYAHHVTEL